MNMERPKYPTLPERDKRRDLDAEKGTVEQHIDSQNSRKIREKNHSACDHRGGKNGECKGPRGRPPARNRGIGDLLMAAYSHPRFIHVFYAWGFPRRVARPTP